MGFGKKAKVPPRKAPLPSEKNAQWFTVELRVQAKRGADPQEIEDEVVRRLDESGSHTPLFLDSFCNLVTPED